MLTALYIQDFVLIDQARLSLGEGLTALTGETGAGKSILLDALGLAAGGRAARAAIRVGARQGAVTAAFEPDGDHGVWALLEENGLSTEESVVILRRVQSADGRGRAFVNDQPVSIARLRQIGESLLEIHGQHDGRGLLSESGHRAMLDEFAALGPALASLRKAWARLREADHALSDARAERERNAREADYLAHVAERLRELDPQPGEEAALAERRAAMMAGEKMSSHLDAAARALEDGAVAEKLAAAARSIERARAALAGAAPLLDDAASRLEAAIGEAGEAGAAILRAIEAYGVDADALEEAEERLFALRGEARKHGLAPDALADFREKIEGALERLEAGEAAFGDLEKAAQAARADYRDQAAAISKKRAKAAKRLDAAVAGELEPLKLGRARFETRVEAEDDHPGPDGVDKVAFMVATNPGAPAGPLKSIASGGELSRFVLAMKAALAAKENRTVIIFDEVDAGVGGAVADAVGERLARLAQGAQVLVVTHSPQVAARASAHFRIDKKQTKSKTTTNVVRLDEEARIEEIARMLSGAEVTDEARAAARRLLGAPTASKAASKTASKRRFKKAS